MGTVPAAAAQIIIAIIPIVGIVTGGGVVLFYLLWRHKQNVKMIEKGMTPYGGIDLKSFSLVAGLLTAGVGFVLSVFFVLTGGATYALLGGLIPLAVGFGLLAFYMLRQNESRR